MLRRGSFTTARRRKAPVALLSFRSVLLAVCVAALLAALTAAASPFVTTAAGSEALGNRLNELSPYATGLQIDGEAPEVGYTRFGGRGSVAQAVRQENARAAAAKRLADTLHGVGAPVLTLESSTLYALGASGDNPVRLMSRTGALDHVRVLAKTSGPGVFISSITAQLGHLKPGDELRFDTSTQFGGDKHLALRVKGVYLALSHTLSTAYWANLYQDIYPMTPDDPPPPSYAFVSPGQLLGALALTGGSVGLGAPGAIGSTPTGSMVELPADPKGLTLSRARVLEQRFAALTKSLPGSALGRELGCSGGFDGSCTVQSSLSSAVLLADGNVSAVKVPISLLGDAGTAIALAVAAAAGSFLVRRRRAEVALGFARGEHVAAFAGRTAVEALGPAVLGGAAGFGIAFGLTSVLAPAGSTDPATVRAGAIHAAVAVAVALALLVGAASVAFLRLYDTGARSAGWLRWLPWELPVLGVAVYLLIEIDRGRGLSGDASNGSAHPTLAVFVFPLLLVAGVSGLVARLARPALRLVSPRAARARRVPVYLALRRLAAARGLLVVLGVVTAVALGAFCYAESLAASLGHTTVEKAYMATGSDAQVLVSTDQKLPKSFPYPITLVQFSNENASLNSEDGVQADVMLVDPATIESAIHWQGAWGANPAGLLRKLASAPSWPLPVIVTRDASGTRALSASGVRVPVSVLGTVQAFPTMAQGVPLVITSYRAMAVAEARTKTPGLLGIAQAYVWGKGPPAAVERALTTSSLGAYYPSSIETFLNDPNVLLATRTYSFMRTVAVAAAVLVLLGLLLYLQARQRSQVIASALGRRMGFDARGEAASVSLEVFAILAFAAVVGGGVALWAAGPVVRHIDPLPSDPPAPLFVLPTGAMLVAAGGLVVVAVLAGVLTTWLARRADVNEELRVA